MRLLVQNYGDVRVFKDRSLFGLPRWVIESIDPDFGFRNTSVFSGIWYKEHQILEIAEKRLAELDERSKEG
mgnify:FL=1|tara:strand:- start:531 stop:743 length:213 start_codon:yes stop_codon:yes gene_type:complete